MLEDDPEEIMSRNIVIDPPMWAVIISAAICVITTYFILVKQGVL